MELRKPATAIPQEKEEKMNEKPADRLDNDPPEPILLKGADDLDDTINEALGPRLAGRAKEFAAADIDAIEVNSFDDAMRRTTLVKQCTIFIKNTEDVRKGVKGPYDAAVKKIQGSFKTLQGPAEAVKAKGLEVLSDYMRTQDKAEVKTDQGQTAYWKETKGVIYSEDKLPEEYFTKTVDTKRLLKDITEGKKVPGAEIHITKTLVVS